MGSDCENISVWPEGNPWPTKMLPPPVLTLEIAVLELEALIQHHEAMARMDHSDHDHDAGLFHEARASFLKQRLAGSAPHRLSPDRQGRA